MQPKWLEWAQQIQAVAQKGLYYSKNPFQIERKTRQSLISAKRIREG